MADEYREELISISEKLSKYNSAMQESLNVLSDEFLLLRDELSTLNQSLEKTRGLDEKLDEFRKTAEVLHALEQRLQTFEKLSKSMEVAESLGGRIEALKGSMDASKERMAEAVSPLNKKMDLLFSKMEESISPLNQKISSFSETLREEKGSPARKEGEELKALALSIQDELNRLQQGFSEQNNALKGIGTSVAYLSSADTDMKRSLETFLKLAEQDREKLSAEKGKQESDAKRKADELRGGKLDEILATLKVQMEQLQKQELLLDGMKSAPKSQAGNDELLKELKKHETDFSTLRDEISAQTKMLALLKDSMPSGNFDEIIKHAEVLNQTTSQKLDSLAELSSSSAKTLGGFKEQFMQLPSLMQNISAALDALVQEMRKSQAAFRSLESKVDSASSRPAESSQDHLENLEMINEKLKGIHSKVEGPQPYEPQLKVLIDELKKFEMLEQQKLEKNTDAAKFAIEGFTSRVDAQLISIKKDISNASKDLESIKTTLTSGADISAEVDFTPVLRKIEVLQNQIANMQVQRPEPPAPQPVLSPVSLTGGQLLDQREILEEMRENLKIFDTFELSDRARIVVDRLNALVRRSLALYST